MANPKIPKLKAIVKDVVEPYSWGFLLTVLLPDAERQIPIIDNTNPAIGTNNPKMLQTSALVLWGAVFLIA